MEVVGTVEEIYMSFIYVLELSEVVQWFEYHRLSVVLKGCFCCRNCCCSFGTDVEADEF